MARELARYEADGQEIVLTDVDIRKVICDNDRVTDAEMKLFVSLCKARRLNPFVKEAHLIKYGDRPATMVVGKDVFTKRAAAHPKFRGLEAGISVQTSDGRFVRREGSMPLPGESIVGGWCKVYVDGYAVPMFDEVSFDEYAGRKRDGGLNGQWGSKPGTMIRKVALVHALREAFPDEFGGMYASEEMGAEAPAPAPVGAAPEAVADAPVEAGVFSGDYCESGAEEPPVYEMEAF